MEQQPIIDGETGMVGLAALFGDPEVEQLRQRIKAYEADIAGMMEVHEQVVRELEHAKRESNMHLDLAARKDEENSRLVKNLRNLEDRCERYERLIDYWMDQQ